MTRTIRLRLPAGIADLIAQFGVGNARRVTGQDVRVSQLAERKLVHAAAMSAQITSPMSTGIHSARVITR